MEWLGQGLDFGFHLLARRSVLALFGYLVIAKWDCGNQPGRIRGPQFLNRRKRHLPRTETTSPNAAALLVPEKGRVERRGAGEP
jgi:hypothetical protein